MVYLKMIVVKVYQLWKLSLVAWANLGILLYRQGSTVVEYVITAPSLQNEQISAAELGILTEMATIYPMLAEGKSVWHIFENVSVFIILQLLADVWFVNCLIFVSVC